MFLTIKIYFIILMELKLSNLYDNFKKFLSDLNIVYDVNKIYNNEHKNRIIDSMLRNINKKKLLRLFLMHFSVEVYNLIILLVLRRLITMEDNYIVHILNLKNLRFLKHYIKMMKMK